MLELLNISKVYADKKTAVGALQDVSLQLPDTGLVVVSGPSGAGKSTLLNILGGLTKADSGEFFIDGIDTATLKENQWNAFRGQRMGFVFQNHALIEYQTVLGNVTSTCEMADMDSLKAQDAARAVLSELGLAELEELYPTYLTASESQLVAVARAVAKNPNIILADEPVSAMDYESAVTVLTYLERLSQDHLVVIALRADAGSAFGVQADEWGALTLGGVVRIDREIQLLGGSIAADTGDEYVRHIAGAATSVGAGGAVCASGAAGMREMQAEKASTADAATGETESVSGSDAAKQKLIDAKRRTFGFLKIWGFAALRMRDKNTRHFAAGIAGALGIIGIAFILSLTTGVQNLVDRFETATLNAFPLEIMGTGYDAEYSVTSIENPTSLTTSTLLTYATNSDENDLKSLKAYFDSGTSGIEREVNAIEYGYSISPQFYAADTSNGAVALSPNAMLSLYGSLTMLSTRTSISVSLSGEAFHAMPATESLYEDSYEMLAGHWPENEFECVVVLNSEGVINDFVLYSLGLLDQSSLKEDVFKLIQNPGSANTIASDKGATYTYEDLLNIKFKLVNSADYYKRDTTYGGWKNASSDASYLTSLVRNGEEATVVGVVRSNATLGTATLDEGVNYPASLLAYVAEQAASKTIVKEQLASPEVDVMTGKTFAELQNESLVTRLESFASSLQALGENEVEKIGGVVTLGQETVMQALGIVGDVADKITSMDIKEIQVNLTKLVADLQAQGYNYPAYPEPTQENFDAANITSTITAKTKADVSAAMLVLVKNQQTAFPYLMALMSSDDLLEAFGTWLNGTDTIVYVDGVSTGKNPVEFMQAVLAGSTGETVTALQTKQFLVSYATSTFPSYVAANVANVKDLMGDKMLEQIAPLLDQNMVDELKSKMGDLKLNLDVLLDSEAITSELMYLVGALVKESGSCAEDNLSKLGYAEMDNPSHIYIFPKSLDGKDNVKAIIDKYNESMKAADQPEKVIVYSDPVGTITGAIVSLARIIGLLPMLLISLSVIVCAVMVGVATQLSSCLRKQEFGVLRACGATRRDVRCLIAADAGTQGFLAAVFGVAFVWLICLIGNILIHSFLGIQGFLELSLPTSLILIVANTILTMIAGIIPAIHGARANIAESIGR